MATTVEAKSREQTPATVEGPAWYRRHQRLLTVVGIVLAGLLVIGWFVIASGKRKEEFAARNLNQARAEAEAGNLPLASSDLQKLITTYRGTDAASEAVIALNQVRMINGQSELAVVGLREFLSKKPPAKYVAPANGLLGAALENAKHWDDAARAYSAAADAAGISYLKAAYLIDAGRTQAEAGHVDEAAKLYRTVVQKYADSPSFTEAQVRLAELTAGKM
jgi:outer membrane protein assembly factor BamD (BamD/ComL family)